MSKRLPKSDPTPLGLGTLCSTVGGPSEPLSPGGVGTHTPADGLADIQEQRYWQNGVAAAIASNRLKPSEYAGDAGGPPEDGELGPELPPIATGSTVTEGSTSSRWSKPSVDSTAQLSDREWFNRSINGSGRTLTTNQGTPIADNQGTLRAGARGPALLEDFIMREKLMHFDHERIPERVVHARGSGAHGWFECYDELTSVTSAAPFATSGKRTPVFVRFSTVAGERGSADTVRDPRGFAVKFYTEEGNWDLVGNNMPVFFIQDGMKFPDLVHATKPEPHHGMPQAASAHDTFWDFVSLMPESTHMLLWVMSDRALPRSYRMMQGFGVHTFRFVNREQNVRLVKFHWIPKAGTHSLLWTEAVRIAGSDPDFHRRDLWESIESGAGAEFELAAQIFTEKQADSFPFDVLDPTKLIPEELVPLRPLGRMVLDRNPDNFFAETEQVAFCTANLIPGLDFTNDPLLQVRNFSYLDTQLLRLGGPNFAQLPINAPRGTPHNYQRDGASQQFIHRGRVNYEPNSLGGGCPFQAGRAGFVSPARGPVSDPVRSKPYRFGDHFSQATLFWNSQTAIEKEHIVEAFTFELSKVQHPGIRARVVSMLLNVSDVLGKGVCSRLGMPLPQPQENASEVIGLRVPTTSQNSPALSLTHRPGAAGIATLRIAVFLGTGVDGDSARWLYHHLWRAGAIPRFVSDALGAVNARDGSLLHTEIPVSVAPPELWDAVVVPHGVLEHDADLALLVQEFTREHYRSFKPILLLGSGIGALEFLPQADDSELARRLAGVVTLPASALPRSAKESAALEAVVSQFMEDLSKRRFFDRLLLN